MTMSMAMSLAGPDSRRRTSLPENNSCYLTEEERAGFIVASSDRRPSAPNFYPHNHHHYHNHHNRHHYNTYHQQRSGTCSPSTTYSPSSSGASSPMEIKNNVKTNKNSNGQHAKYGSSPILTPFQWTSDLRQYIMTDIGPQPSNSQMPTLRSQSHFVRQKSCAKMSPITGASQTSTTCDQVSPMSTMMVQDSCCDVPSSLSLSQPSVTSNTGYSRYSTITDLCTIPQDEILPPMEAPLDRRFAHEEWDDEDD